MCVCAHTHTRVKCVQGCVCAVSTADWTSRYTCPTTHAHAHTHCTRTHIFSPACQGIRYSSPLHEEYDPRLPHWLSVKERCVSENTRYVRMMHFCVPRENRPPHRLPHYWRSDLPMLSSPVRNQVEKRNIRKLFLFCLATPSRAHTLTHSQTRAYTHTHLLQEFRPIRTRHGVENSLKYPHCV